MRAQGNLLNLELLLDGGTDPNALVPTDVDDPTRPGQKVSDTALVRAVSSHQEAAVGLLLERGADADMPNSVGQTPIMMAAHRGGLAVVRLLLGRQVQLDSVEEEAGLSAFHFACFSGHAACAAELVLAGCDTTLRSKQGKTGRE